jgi:hypothetical protein
MSVRGQATPSTIVDTNVALHSKVQALEDTLTGALATIACLELRLTKHSQTCQGHQDSAEQRIADCEDQMDRYPGDWEIAGMNERINSAVDFDGKLLEKLDVVNERLSTLEQSTSYRPYSTAARVDNNGVECIAANGWANVPCDCEFCEEENETKSVSGPGSPGCGVDHWSADCPTYCTQCHEHGHICPEPLEVPMCGGCGSYHYPDSQCSPMVCKW